MRRIVIIALVLAIFVGSAILLSRLFDDGIAFQKARGISQNAIAKTKPQPVIKRPAAVVPAKPHEIRPMTPGNVPPANAAASKSGVKPEDSPPAPAMQPPVNRLPYPAPPLPDEWAKLAAVERLANARERLQPQLNTELTAKGCQLGDKAFVRIFKESNELELWLKPRSAPAFSLFCNYRIAFFSGVLGPKTKEGDMQAPEGFYSVPKSQLNPSSRYHLAFNVGYPNALDRALNRTGSLIMVHGSNVSIGCFAMTDPVIEEIYLIVEAALNQGQERVPVHVFPFRMTEERMTRTRDDKSEWLDFWMNLKEGYDAFEKEKQPPAVSFKDQRYNFTPDA